MIRVYAHPARPHYFALVTGVNASGEWADFDANMATTGPDGSLTLVRVDVRVVTNPSNVSEKRVEQSNPQLVRIVAAGLWGDVENLDLKETTT